MSTLPALSDIVHPSSGSAFGGGGADPWTVVRLANDFTISTVAYADVTGVTAPATGILGFTPAANTRYEFEGRFLLRTAAAATGARIGIAWPTGMSDGVASIYLSASATAEVQAHGNIAGVVQCANTGHPTTTGSWPGHLVGVVLAGASPSGQVKIQAASETAATNVIVKAGSFIRYRSIP